jgi:AcrR family transcriptional regulator
VATADPVEASKRGRPRSAEADRAITGAALQVLADDGVGAFCVEAVATRAGVSKATIYRRFPNKESLMVESLASLNDDLPPVPDTGSTRSDLVALLDSWRERHDSSPAGRIMTRKLSAARTNPELFSVYFDRVVQPRRDRFRAVIRRGVERGELRDDLGVELAVTAVIGPTVLMLATATPGGSPADVDSHDLVDLVLTGLARR